MFKNTWKVTRAVETEYVSLLMTINQKRKREKENLGTEE